MSAEREQQAICNYLIDQHVLTLCTQDEDGLWCANCFYVFDAEKMCFYLMTDDKARHTQGMLRDGHVVGTVTDQTQTIAHIQGIQYTGIASRVTAVEQSQVKSLYCERFPIARLKSAPLWQIQLLTVKMTDNKLGFGKKHFWQRSLV